jgi:hypothetical protein
MTKLKVGQHYDTPALQTVQDATALLSAIKKHLEQEEHCNHTLSEIVQEALT